MNKKGFTLVEILTVIVILTVISVTIFPIVVEKIENGRQRTYNLQITSIKKAAEEWALKHIASIPSGSSDVLTLNLGDLKIGGFIDIDIVNPLTNKSFPNDMLITITKVRNQYEILVLEDTGTDITEENIIVKESPVIVLNGSYLTYVEINDEYEEQGAYAYSYLGENITYSIGREIIKDNIQKAMVDTTEKGTYKIYYIIVDPNNGYRNLAIRTVIVRDTTPPDILFDESTTILTQNASSFNPMTGVSAVDNSGEHITVTYEGHVDSQPGNYIITYTASDSSGNIKISKRLVEVTDAGASPLL